MKMEQKLKLISKIKYLSLIFVLPFSSCSNIRTFKTDVYAFDTFVSFTIDNVDDSCFKNFETEFKNMSNLFDGYRSYEGLNNLYTINHSNDFVEVDEKLKDIISASISFNKISNNLFNPLIKNLSDMWKESLAKNEVPLKKDIDEKLEEMKSSTIEIEENKIKRNGNATIDLGAVAKGYAINKGKTMMKERNIKSYIINAGSSSIALGNKSSNDGYYNVSIEHFNNAYLKLKECSLSTSSIYKQGVKIDGVTYSHIINPINGSAINNYDMVIAIGNDGLKLDAASTIGMISEESFFQTIESSFECKLLVFKENSIIYKNSEIEIYYV